MYKIDLELKDLLVRQLKQVSKLLENIDKKAVGTARVLNKNLSDQKRLIAATYTSQQSLARSYDSAIKASTKYYQSLQRIKGATADISRAKIQSFLLAGPGDLGGMARTVGEMRKLGATKATFETHPMMMGMKRKIAKGEFISATELYNLGKKTGVNFTSGMLDEINKEIGRRPPQLSRLVAQEKKLGKTIHSTMESGLYRGGKAGMGRLETYMKGRLMSIVSFFGIYGVGRALGSAMQLRVQKEQIERSIAAILPNFGIKGDIRERLRFAKGEMIRFRREMTGLGVDPYAVQGSYMQYLASSKSSLGLARQNFSAFMLLGKVYGLNTEEIKSMTYALTQMQSKGVVTAEELKRQLGNALPGAVKLFSDAMGMTTRQFLAKMKTGSLEAQTTITAVAKHIEEKFGDLGNFLTEDFGTSMKILSANWKSLSESLTTGSGGVALKLSLGILSKILYVAKEFAPVIGAIAVSLTFLAIRANQARVLNSVFGVQSLRQLLLFKGGMNGAIGSTALMFGVLEMAFTKFEKIRNLATAGERGSIWDYLILGGTGLAGLVMAVKTFKSLADVTNMLYKSMGGFIRLKKTLLVLLKKELLMEMAIAFFKNPATFIATAAVAGTAFAGWKYYDAEVNERQKEISSSGARNVPKDVTQKIKMLPIDLNLNLTNNTGFGADATTGKRNDDLLNFNFNAGNQL